MSAAFKNGARRQAGVGLVELLISMMLGLVIISALVIMYVGGGQALRNAQAQGQMNEDAQIALAVITHELRQAGYNPRRDASGAKNDLGQKLEPACLRYGFHGHDRRKLRNISALRCNAGGGRLCAGRGLRRRPQQRQKHREQRLPMDCIGSGVKATSAEARFYVMQARLYVEENAS
jgi:type IV pilus assembly protein PilW